jgi:amidase
MATLKESGEPSIPNIGSLPWPSKLDINELWDAHLQKYAFQCEYLEQIRLTEERLGKEIDAIITPVAPTAAVRHDKFSYYGYTNLVNLLDFTSVAVPVTFADKNIDKKQEDYKPLNETDKSMHEECKY